MTTYYTILPRKRQTNRKEEQSMSLNKSRRRAFERLAEGPLTNEQIVVERFQRRTFEALAEIGLAKYRPYGKPPTWALTSEGRARHG